MVVHLTTTTTTTTIVTATTTAATTAAAAAPAVAAATSTTPHTASRVRKCLKKTEPEIIGSRGEGPTKGKLQGSCGDIDTVTVFPCYHCFLMSVQQRFEYEI